MTEPLVELQRLKRVADMLCTAHAGLRDRYRRFSLTLDLLILAASAWLLIFLFADPEITARLTPFHLNPRIWLGIVALCTFCLSIVQIKVDWKARSDAHARSLSVYTEVKRQCGSLLTRSVAPPTHEVNAILEKYYSAPAFGIELPEKEFLRQKRRHLMKVEVSKFLDKHPGASPRLLHLKLWWRDNFRNESGQTTE